MNVKHPYRELQVLNDKDPRLLRAIEDGKKEYAAKAIKAVKDLETWIDNTLFKYISGKISDGHTFLSITREDFPSSMSFFDIEQQFNIVKNELNKINGLRIVSGNLIKIDIYW